jgi:hypothetical protein
METGNVGVVLMRISANECNAATEDLARYLDTELPPTGESLTARELLAAFLHDLSNECLTRWGPQVRSHQHSTTEPLEWQARRPDAASAAPRRIVANVFAGPWGEPAAAYQ